MKWPGSRFSLLNRILLAWVLITPFIAVPSQVGDAHAALVRSDPSDNAILATSPPEIRLWFNEPLSPEFSTAKILDIKGQEVTLQSLRIAPEDPYQLVLVPPDLEDGVYSINWKVLSEADGHFTQGLLVFGIGEGADVGSVGGGETQERVPPLEVILRWLKFGFLAALAGALIVGLFVLGPLARAEKPNRAIDNALERISRWALISSTLTIIIGFFWFAYQYSVLLQSVPEGASVLKVATQLLVRTRWGVLWMLYMGLAGLTVWLLQSRGVKGFSLAAILAGFLLVVQALSGHAAAVLPLTTLAIAVDALHLIAVSVWIGGLLALVIGLVPEIKKPENEWEAIARAGWRPFSRWAALSVGLIFASGFYNTGQQVANLDALISSLYGRALLGKISLMLLVGLFGLLNAAILHPGLSAPLARLLKRPPGWTLIPIRWLRVTVLFEVSIGLFIFLGAGLLTAAPPARGPEYEKPEGAVFETLTEQVDDMLITFSAKPNLPGQNVFTIRAVSVRRPPPYEVLRVIVHFTYLAQDMGTVSVDAEEVEPGLYRLGGGYLSLAGLWDVEIAVRRSGIEDTVATFAWNVPATTEGQDVILSDKPWQPLLGWLAIVFGFISVMAAIFTRSKRRM